MTSGEVIRLISKYRTAGIVVDTGLVLLLVIGTYDPRRITSFKRTLTYTPSDYLLLVDLLSRFSLRLTTPNILTEVDNLGRQIPERERGPLIRAMTRIVDDFVELYHPSGSVVGTSLHSHLGLTDTITAALATNHLVLTDDLPLWARLTSVGRDAININHLRL